MLVKIKNAQAVQAEALKVPFSNMDLVVAEILAKYGWKGGTGNLPSAYLVGMIAGKKAVELILYGCHDLEEIKKSLEYKTNLHWN